MEKGRVLRVGKRGQFKDGKLGVLRVGKRRVKDGEKGTG